MRMLHSGLNDSHSLRRLDSTKTESLFYKSVDRFRCSETADLTGKDEILRSALFEPDTPGKRDLHLTCSQLHLHSCGSEKKTKLSSKHCEIRKIRLILASYTTDVWNGHEVRGERQVFDMPGKCHCVFNPEWKERETSERPPPQMVSSGLQNVNGF